MTSNILDEIDGVIDDWRVSDDAMRWVPEDARAEVDPGVGPVVDLTDWIRVTAECTASIAASMRKLSAVCAQRSFSWQMLSGQWALRSARRVEDGPARHGAVKHARDQLRAARKRVSA